MPNPNRRPAVVDLRRERRDHPGVHHVGVWRQLGRPAGRAGRHRRRVRQRVHRQVLQPGQHRLRAGVAEPHRERHPVTPLPGDVPVPLEPVDPVLEPAAHERGDPLELGRAGPEPVGVLPHRDEPLRPDLELHRRLAPLVHPDDLPHRFAADQQPGLVEGLDDGRTGLGQRQPGELACQLAETAVRLHHQPQVQAVPPPLQHVLAVAERAHHHQPGAVLRVHRLVGEDRHLVAEQRHDRPLQPGVPGVGGMVVQRHAGRQQLRPGGGDQQVLPVRAAEPDRVQPAGPFQVLHVGLGQRGAVLRAPQDRVLGPPQVARLVQRDEAGLRGPLAPCVDGGVAQRPVHRQAEPPPQVLVPFGHPPGLGQAQRVELGPGHVHRPDPVGLLHVPLGRQPVVVEPDRVEHPLAAHPPVADDEIRLRVAHRVTDVQVRRRYVGRRRVHAEHEPVPVPVVPVDVVRFPQLPGGGLDRPVVILAEFHT